jgi:hypothetical protein
MQKVSEAMPALIEEAFRDAQEAAFSAMDCQLVRDGHADKAAYERYDRALIAAYLSHPAVRDAIRVGHGRAYWPDLDKTLQAIGARKP